MRSIVGQWARLATLPVALAAGVAQAQKKQAGDWLVACSNIRSCTAIGFATAGSDMGVTRGPS